MATVLTPSGASSQSRDGVSARLILEDPLAFDQATQPKLRASTELVTQGEPAMSRESARELWETLRLDTQAAQQQLIERRRLAAQAESLVRESEKAKQQALQLQQMLDDAERERFQHPVIYAGAIVMAGVGALWWLERRKRQRYEERELDDAALPDSLWPLEAQSSNSMPGTADLPWEASPEFAKDYATNLSGITDPITAIDNVPVAGVPETDDLLTAGVNAREPVLEIEPIASQSDAAQGPNSQGVDGRTDTTTPAWAKPKVTHLPAEEELAASSGRTSSWRFFGALRGMFGRSRAAQAKQSDGLPESSTALHPPSTGPMSTILETRQLVSNTSAELGDTLPPSNEVAQPAWLRYGPDEVADGDSAAQTNLPSDSLAGEEAALEHLLELRTTVEGLCALGRPQEAALLLATHIGLEPHTTAWAYLEYMQLCERLDKPDEFAQMRHAYRKQFNRMPPYWHEPNANVLGLDGYSRAASELCSAWSRGPQAAQQLIQAWLVGAPIGRKFVQLPAFHDLFDLYELLEFANTLEPAAMPVGQVPVREASVVQPGKLDTNDDADFLPTVSLLDLDYEFSSDVTLDRSEAEKAETSVTIVKPGEFSLDFNLEGEQTGGLFSQPSPLAEK